MHPFQITVIESKVIPGVYLRTWSGADRVTFFDFIENNQDRKSYYGNVLIRSVCDPDGKKLYDHSHLAEIAEEWDGYLCEKVMMEALKLNRIDSKAQEEEKKFLNQPELMGLYFLRYQFNNPYLDLPSDEITRWQVFFSIYPPLEQRFDVLMSQLTAAVVAPYKKGVKPTDFLVDWSGERQRKNREAGAERLKAMLKARSKSK